MFAPAPRGERGKGQPGKEETHFSDE
jgi:hypothetical protein